MDFLRGFYQALSDRPLEPDEAWYVHMYANPKLAPSDPVQQLATAIEWSELESTHLLSGFRGAGKSTELRRLRARLSASGHHKVVLVDMLEYLNLSVPIDLADFLIAVAGAFSDALASDPELLGDDPSHESYWTRVVGFLRDSEVELAGAGVDLAPVSLRANIRQDPSFRRRLRERMEGRIGALVRDVHDFLERCVHRLQARHGPDTQVVLLLDSVEQIRGTSINNAESVYASVEALFANHAESLHFRELHVVYTVPPWLKIRSPGIAAEYGSSQMLPCIKVLDRSGAPFEPGLDALRQLVGRRGDWERLLGDVAVLDRLILASGGYLRDLFRLLQACLRHARGASLPLSPDGVERALHEVRNSYLPLARSDARWLADVAETHDTGLGDHAADGPSGNSLYHLARFFDTHLVLCYLDGDEWYDVHALLRDEIARLAAVQPAPPPPATSR